jgi:NAD(P)H-hydrate repair Nnr-like enzyme with NAD(P)H-hydrate epimerase domain
VLRRVTIFGFDSPFIVENGKGLRDWATLKGALVKESERLRDLANSFARLRQTKCSPLKDDPRVLIDAIFGMGFPGEGGFDQFSVPLKDMFDAQADNNDRKDAISGPSTFWCHQP